MAESKVQVTSWRKAGRIALIPVLGAVLLTVCFWPNADDTTVLQKNAETGGDRPAPLVGPQEASTVAVDNSPRMQLPPVTLDKILEHDPFALPQEVSDELLLGHLPTEEQKASARQERIDEMVDSLQQVKLSVVVSGSEGVWARLGDRIVHEGDEIEPGVRIMKITPQGLTLEVSDETPVEVPEID